MNPSQNIEGLKPKSLETRSNSNSPNHLIITVVDFESVKKIPKNLIFAFTIVLVIWSPEERA
jgi:hypothetical protein